MPRQKRGELAENIDGVELCPPGPSLKPLLARSRAEMRKQ